MGFLSFLAVAFLLVRLIPWFRTRFMWTLRNRLIVAYVFIAVVPVILLLTMVGVGSYLLYLELGAHLLHDDLQERVSIIGTPVGIDRQCDRACVGSRSFAARRVGFAAAGGSRVHCRGESVIGRTCACG